MDQADKISISDRLATNNIMVFNLQPQPPGGVGGNNGTPHIFGIVPWSRAGISQSGPEMCCPPGSRRMARPDFQTESGIVDEDGDHARWMHPQGFVQSRSGSVGWDNLDASSQYSFTHRNFDKVCFQQDIWGHHQASATPVHSSESPVCPQAFSSDFCCSFSSRLHANLRPAKVVLSCGDLSSTPNQAVLYQDQAEGGIAGTQVARKVFTSLPVQGQPMKFSEKTFKAYESEKNLQYYSKFEEGQSQESQTRRMSQRHRSRCGVQYFIPQNDKGDHNIQYFMPVQTQGHHQEALPMQSSAPVSFTKPQSRVIQCNPTSRSGTDVSADSTSESEGQYLSLHSAPKEESYYDPEGKENLASHGSHYSAKPQLQTSKDCDSDNFHLQVTPPVAPSSAAEHIVPFHLGTYSAQGAVSSTVNSITVASGTNAASNVSETLDIEQMSSDDRIKNHASKSLSRPEVNQHPEGSGQDDQNDSAENDEDVVYLGTDPPSDRNVDCVKPEKDSSTADRDYYVGAAWSHECEAESGNSVQPVHTERTHQGSKRAEDIDLETEATSPPIGDNVPIMDAESSDVAALFNNGEEPLNSAQSSLSCCLGQTATTVQSEESCSGFKILETVSLAALQPLGQRVYWRRLSAEGFYRCGCQRGKCSYTSQFQAWFESHLLEAHPTAGEYPCVHCGNLERSQDALLFHLDQHLDFQRFSLYCTEPTCDFHSFSPENVASHMAICHPNLSTHTCWRCGHMFSSLQQLVIHIKRSTLQVAICPHCDAKDTDGQRILHHMVTEHPGHVRMIAFHNIMVCRERKMSGWSHFAASLKNAADCCIATSDEKTCHRIGTDDEIQTGHEIGSGDEIETDSADGNGTDSKGDSYETETDAGGIGSGTGMDTEGGGSGIENDTSGTSSGFGAGDGIGTDTVGTGDGTGTAKGTGDGTDAKGNGEENGICVDRDSSSHSLPSLTSETDSLCSPPATRYTEKYPVVTVDRDKELMVTVDSAVDKTATHTNTSVEDASQLKLLLRWNEEGLRVVEGNSGGTELDRAESHSKLGMEPMDYEITAGTSADSDLEESDHGDVLSPSDESTISASPKSALSATLYPENPDKAENSHCTVMPADDTTRLVSSNNNSCSEIPNSARPLKAAKKPKSKKRKKKHTDVSTVQKLLKTRSKARVYTCLLCSFISHCSPGIYQHMYTKHKEILECPMCKGRSKNRTSFFSHLTACHPEEAKAIYEQRKITNWISITPITTLMDTGNCHRLLNPLKLLNKGYAVKDSDVKDSEVKDYAVKGSAKDYAVRDYFVLSGHGKDRSFHCVFCEFSFKKNHRSNVHIYRSMYKHMFLKHIPHRFQCPCCSFTDCSESKVRKHIHDKHGYADQEPRMFLLPRCTNQTGSDWYKQVVDPGNSSGRETATTDTATFPAQDSEDAPADHSLDAALDTQSRHREAVSTSSHFSPQYSLPVPSQSVFPERERVPSYARHAPVPCFASQDMEACHSPAQLSKKRTKLTKMTAKCADEKNKAASDSKPRDFYSVELSGDVHVFSCLHCNYRRTAAKGNFSAQAATIFHVRRKHMDKRTFWRCSLCEFRGLKHSRVGRHNKRIHQGKATIIKECGMFKDLRRK